MAFTWQNSTNEGDEVKINQLNEIKVNLDELNQSILEKNPQIDKVETSDLDNVLPGREISTAATQDARDYLDQLKSENYCRSYYGAKHEALNTAKNDAVYSGHQ
jgi:hypothetical protein